MASWATCARVVGILAAAAGLAACGGVKKRPMTLPPPAPDAGPDLPAPTIADAPGDNVTPPGPDANPPGPETSLPGSERSVPGPEVGRSGPEAGNPPPDVEKDLAIDSPIEAGHDVSVATPCKTALSGTAAFGAEVTGSASFSNGFDAGPSRTMTITAHVYFPTGRVPGAKVQLAMPSPVVPNQYFFGAPVTLADDLSATGLSVGGHDEIITADLLPGDGGLQATVSANFSDPGNDVVDDRTAAMLMCPSGDVPAPALAVSIGVAAPLTTFSLNATAPLTTEAIDTLRILTPAGAVPIEVSTGMWALLRWGSGPNFTVAATTAFPPGQPLTFDATGIRDVLGRAVPLALGGTQVLATSNVLDDLTFATAPPAGAVACSACTGLPYALPDAGVPGATPTCTGGCTVANGLLTVRAAPYWNRNEDGLFALPPTTATRLRVRLAVGETTGDGKSCANGNSSASLNWAAMAVVGPNGESSARVYMDCDGAMTDYAIDLPSASPLWLTIHVEGTRPKPYSMPSLEPPPVIIDELEFM